MKYKKKGKKEFIKFEKGNLKKYEAENLSHLHFVIIHKSHKRGVVGNRHGDPIGYTFVLVLK